MKRKPENLKDSGTGIQKVGFELERLFDVIQDEIVVLDKDLNIVRHNAAIENVTGRSVVGEKCYRAIRGQNKPCTSCQTVLAFETKTMQSQEIKMESDKGEAVWKEAISYPMFDGNGEVIGAVEYVQNITDRKEAERALRESEEKYRCLVENANEGIIVLQDGRRQFCNRKAMEIYGRTEEEMKSEPAITFIHPEDREASLDYYNRKINGEETPENFSLRIIRKDGEVRWLENNSGLITWQGQDATLNILNDVTDRRRAEDALKESETQYRIFFKNAPVGIGIVDEKGNIIEFNDAILRPGGYTRRDAEKITNVVELYQRPEDRDEIDKLARKQGFVDNQEIRLKRKDGSFYDALLSLRPIKIQGKMCWQSIVQDITPLKKAGEALRRAYDDLEAKVQERTREMEGKNQALEELNTALKVLLERREDDKREAQEKITLSINHLVKPYFERMKSTRLEEAQSAFLDIIESNLDEIFSPFTENLSSQYLRLTPAEIQVANLVKEGKITKEIAEMLNLSIRTIESHRKNIRKKLGITDKKTNLRTHLMSL